MIVWVEFAIRYIIDTFIFLWRGRTDSQPVLYSSEEARFPSTAILSPAVEPRIFKVPVYEYVVLYFANDPPTIYINLQ